MCANVAHSDLPLALPVQIMNPFVPLDDLVDRARLQINNPPRDGDVLVHSGVVLEEIDILDCVLLQIRKRQEILEMERGDTLLAQVLDDDGVALLVVECQHATVCVLDNDDLPCSEQVLRDDDAADRVLGAAPGVADNVGLADLDAELCGGVDTCVHACDCGSG